MDPARDLAGALERGLPRWIGRVAPEADPAPILDAVLPEVRALLAQDVDEQKTTPLAIVRDIAVPMLTAALRDAGRPPIDPGRRDPFLVERFPDDVYGLTPSSWADIDASVVEAGITWGAAKAWEHKQRHRA